MCTTGKKNPRLLYTLSLIDNISMNNVMVYNPKVFTTKSNHAYSFDSDTKTACADNCANCHVWNELEDFEDYRELKPKERKVSIETVGDSSTPVGIGTVKTDWKDDDDKYNHIKLTNVYYMPDFLVKVLSVTCLVNEFQDKYENPDKKAS